MALIEEISGANLRPLYENLTIRAQIEVSAAILIKKHLTTNS